MKENEVTDYYCKMFTSLSSGQQQCKSQSFINRVTIFTISTRLHLFHVGFLQVFHIIQGTLDPRQEYTLDGMPSQCIMHTHIGTLIIIKGEIRVASPPTGMFYGHGRKHENVEKCLCCYINVTYSEKEHISDNVKHHLNYVFAAETYSSETDKVSRTVAGSSRCLEKLTISFTYKTAQQCG